jgi:LysR family hca operon transcriptional activator
MELRHLRYVVAVAESLNFREASRRLHVSQPSLSVQIKQLEDEVGVRLFHRSKRHVEITRGGEVFLITAREVLSMLERSSAAARQTQQGEVGTIRIGFVPTASFAILPRLLEEIKKQLPLVQVELKEWPEATQIRELQSGALDIGITHREKVSDRLESMLLLRERLLLALSKHHQAARKKAVNFDDVRDDLLLIPRKDLFPYVHQMIVRIFVAGGVTLNRTQAIEHVQTAIALAAANAGFAFVPESADKLWPQEVIFRPLDTIVPKFETVALWLRGNADPLVRRILEILRQIYAEPDSLIGRESRC